MGDRADRTAGQARVRSAAESVAVSGVAYVSLVLVMITGTVGLGDRLAWG